MTTRSTNSLPVANLRELRDVPWEKLAASTITADVLLEGWHRMSEPMTLDDLLASFRLAVRATLADVGERQPEQRALLLRRIGDVHLIVGEAEHAYEFYGQAAQIDAARSARDGVADEPNQRTRTSKASRRDEAAKARYKGTRPPAVTDGRAARR